MKYRLYIHTEHGYKISPWLNSYKEVQNHPYLQSKASVIWCESDSKTNLISWHKWYDPKIEGMLTVKESGFCHKDDFVRPWDK